MPSSLPPESLARSLSVGTRPQAKHLILILAREFAAELAVPVLLTDADGRLVYLSLIHI